MEPRLKLRVFTPLRCVAACIVNEPLRIYMYLMKNYDHILAMLSPYLTKFVTFWRYFCTIRFLRQGDNIVKL